MIISPRTAIFTLVWAFSITRYCSITSCRLLIGIFMSTERTSAPTKHTRSRYKYTFLHSAVSRPWDCSKLFTLHTPVDLLIPKPTRHLWNAISRVAVTYIHSHIHNCLKPGIYSCIHLSELEQRGVNEIV